MGKKELNNKTNKKKKQQPAFPFPQQNKALRDSKSFLGAHLTI